ncbi:HlyD family secretion protein [Rhodohalobacter sp. 8-1]|uniref:HlyD family secretion protein n=1 Tax=Rhodohalobacter sp. 8-1 TaxID=3131972 RepID=UPI0030ED76AE
MKQELFPKEIIDNSQESNFSKHTVQSKLIYSSVVLSVIGVICALPFIKVDVGIRGQGMLRPVNEVMKIVSPVSANIVSMTVGENSYIKKGDVIAILDDADIRDRLRFIQSRKELLDTYISDINLLKSNVVRLFEFTPDLKTERYKRAALEFRQQLLNYRETIDQKKRSFERETHLHEQGATSLLVLEESQYLLQQEENKFKLFLEQQQNTWSLDGAAFQTEVEELLSEQSQLKNKKKMYEVFSPASGTLQNLNSLSANSFIYTNQVIAELSPDTTIVAEVYIPPNDIGLLSENMDVRLQVDAFDHNQWGTASGKIKSISSDMILVENSPLFKVRCSIDQSFLELSNGFKGQLKKGMTIQARFIISRRSLFQLLYNNMDDWLNPSWSTSEDQMTSSNT